MMGDLFLLEDLRGGSLRKNCSKAGFGGLLGLGEPKPAINNPFYFWTFYTCKPNEGVVMSGLKRRGGGEKGRDQWC